MSSGGKMLPGSQARFVHYSHHMFVMLLEACQETLLLQTKMGGKGVCHDIKGTDGTLFAPGLDTDKSLWVFVPELCRSIWLDYDTDVTVMDIPAKRFRYWNRA